MAHTFQRIRCDEVNIGERHRQDLGELEVFGSRVKERGGLFQPIVVKRSGKQFKLLAGERRLRAQRDILHEPMIPAVIVEVTTRLDELLFERDENEMHKSFNPIEAAKLGMEIEKELGNRQGQRTDLAASAAKSPKGKTADIAGELVGFKSGDTYERAKKVVANGTETLKEAVADGTVSVADGAAVSEEPPKKQDTAIATVRKGKAKTAKAAVARKPKQGRVIFDDRQIEPLIGKLTRLFDQRYAAHGKKHPKHHDDCIRPMSLVLSAWKRWQKEST